MLTSHDWTRCSGQFPHFLRNWNRLQFLPMSWLKVFSFTSLNFNNIKLNFYFELKRTFFNTSDDGLGSRWISFLSFFFSTRCVLQFRLAMWFFFIFARWIEIENWFSCWDVVLVSMGVEWDYEAWKTSCCASHMDMWTAAGWNIVRVNHNADNKKRRVLKHRPTWPIFVHRFHLLSVMKPNWGRATQDTKTHS